MVRSAHRVSGSGEKDADGQDPLSGESTPAPDLGEDATPRRAPRLPRPPAHVLLVEDDEVLRANLERVLRKAEFEVTAVAEGGAALAAVESRFDVVVSDVAFPGASGLSLLRKARSRHPDVPVILITGAPSVESATAAIEEGVFRYLWKPVAPEKLLEVVHGALAAGQPPASKRGAMQIEGAAEPDDAELATRFQSALENLWMAFQPVLSLRSGTAVGFEAFLRTDESTLANPLHFLDAAQRLGLTHTLARTIRAQVAAAAASAPPEALLFVNVHSGELDDFELCSSKSPLSSFAGRVVLEVTKRQALDSVQGLRARVDKLRRLGFSVAVDGLGGGYAGLSSLSILEPEFVKLDVSLIRGVDASKRKQSVVRSMISLCERDLSMRVICQGVETAGERDALAALGCDLVQGYVFGRPSRSFGPNAPKDQPK